MQKFRDPGVAQDCPAERKLHMYTPNASSTWILDVLHFQGLGCIQKKRGYPESRLTHTVFCLKGAELLVVFESSGFAQEPPGREGGNAVAI